MSKIFSLHQYSMPGGLHLKPPKFEHIFIAVISSPSPFFCADTFDINVLFIVCALRWYVKCLYRHLFVEDTSKKARVTKMIASPNLWQKYLQGALELFLLQIRRCNFFSDPYLFGCIFYGRCILKYFTYHLKAHSISNKLVSKVSAQKKGGNAYDSFKYVFKFW